MTKAFENGTVTFQPDLVDNINVQFVVQQHHYVNSLAKPAG
ncbi:MAG: hypothetical protein ACPG5L_10125 [Vibrio gallaecicus]